MLVINRTKVVDIAFRTYMKARGILISCIIADTWYPKVYEYTS